MASSLDKYDFLVEKNGKEHMQESDLSLVEQLARGINVSIGESYLTYREHLLESKLSENRRALLTLEFGSDAARMHFEAIILSEGYSVHHAVSHYILDQRGTD